MVNTTPHYVQVEKEPYCISDNDQWIIHDFQCKTAKGKQTHYQRNHKYYSNFKREDTCAVADCKSVCLWRRPRERNRTNCPGQWGQPKELYQQQAKESTAQEGRGMDSINLNTFGSKKYIKQHCDRVELTLRVGEDVFVIKVLSFPTICTLIAACVSISNYPHLALGYI